LSASGEGRTTVVILVSINEVELTQKYQWIGIFKNLKTCW